MFIYIQHYVHVSMIYHEIKGITLKVITTINIESEEMC
jgi:hypothetical protein